MPGEGSIRHRVITILSTTLLYVGPAPAQEAAAPERWDVSAEFSYTDQTGNKVLRLLTAGLRFSHLEQDRFELDGSVESRYGRSDGQTVAQNHRAELSFDLHPEERWSPFVFASAERDRFKRLDLRATGGAGAKYTPYRDPARSAEASLSLALLASFEDRDLGPGPAQIDERQLRARWSGRVRAQRALGEGVTLRHVTFYQPQVARMADYLLRSQTGIKVLLTERLALSVEYQWDRDSEPPEGVKPDDRLLKTGLIIDF